MKPNILVCGKTGVGKTSLIQAVTHRGVVPDSAIGYGKATTVGFDVYETEIANFIDSEGMNPGSQSVDDYADFILDEMFDRLESDDAEKVIHNIWYCIDGSGARIQDTDAKLIKTFSDKVLLVVTKCELMRKEQTEAMMNTLLDLIDRDRIVMVSAENKTGLTQLIKKAQEMASEGMEAAEEELDAFRERWDDYYSNMRETWIANVSDEADSYINWAAGRAAAIALVPLPLADVAPLIANEVYMIYKLSLLSVLVVGGKAVIKSCLAHRNDAVVFYKLFHIAIVNLLVFGDVAWMKTDCRKAKIVLFRKLDALYHFRIVGAAVDNLFNTHFLNIAEKLI
jgi:GTPase Era involved in 16S rRNA processing